MEGLLSHGIQVLFSGIFIFFLRIFGTYNVLLLHF